MASDTLYDLAFAYKKTRLWKKLYDSEIFAVAMPDGETAYCSAMGQLGDHIALGIYVGQAGFDSFRYIMFAAEEDDYSPEVLLSQDCLQCAFENREYLSDQEVEEVRRYTKSRGIMLRGPHAWPQFLRYKPRQYPWPCNREDEARIAEALSAAIALSDMLDGNRKRDLGLAPLYPEEVEELENRSIPLLKRKDGEFVLLRTDLPEPAEERWPTPEPLDPATAEKIRALKKQGIFQCEILWLPAPMQEDETQPPAFPAMLLCLDSRQHYILPVEPILNYEEHPERLLSSFTDALMRENWRPAAVKVRNSATRALLEGMCAQCGILLSQEEDLPALEEVREELLESMSGDDGPEMEDEALEWLMELSDEDLLSMPEPLSSQIVLMAEQGILPEALGWRILRIFGRA